MTDIQLLRQYAAERSQAAFAELVKRHLGWVHAAAKRLVRDAHLAEDLSQAVFLALAQKAASLPETTVLPAWLFRATRYAASVALRSEHRRRKHEQEAAMASVSKTSDENLSASEWEQVAGVLEGSVRRLGEKDRQAILLRFYQQLSFSEVGYAMAISEEAARKRVDRAVQKLRPILQRQRITLSAGALAAGLWDNAAQAVSTTLAESVVASAMPGALIENGVLTITKGVLHMMLWNHLKFVAAIYLLLILVAGAAIAVAIPGRPQTRPSSAAPPPTIPSATRPATQPGAAMTPKQVVVAAYQAGLAGDEEGFIKHFSPVTPQQEQTLRQMVHQLAAVETLQKSIVSKFGPQPEQRALISGVLPSDITKAQETITGDSAVVDIGTSGPGKIPVIKVGQTWKMSPEILNSVNAAAVARLEAMVPPIRQLAADVEAGKYRSLQELETAMQGLMR